MTGLSVDSRVRIEWHLSLRQELYWDHDLWAF